MAIIALIPGALALVVALRRGAARAFIDIYLPVLLLLPDYFRWIAPGLPDPTMSEAAILPIAAIWLLRSPSRWRLSTTDALVVAFAALTAYTEYRAKGYADAQNLLFDAIGSIVLPYVLAKALIMPQGLSAAVARRIVMLLAIVTLSSLYEFRMGRPLVRVLLDPFFPGQGSWVTTFRYGFARVAGPYGHAILAGMIFVVGYRLQRWLEWTDTGHQRLWSLPITKGRALTLVLALGVAITLVRGPLLGGLAGGALLVIARSQRRRQMAALVLAAVLLIGLPAFVAFWSYASVGRANATSISQETAAYRKELLDNYVAIALQHAAWGWGRNQWPQVAGMESADNHYLLLALNHGLIALSVFVALIVSLPVRLTLYGARRARDDPGALLAFTLAGCYVAFFVSLATVYQGMQAVQLFFLLAGWSDALLQDARGVVREPATVADQVRPYHFHRVLA